jgi:hypothetical protein
MNKRPRRVRPQTPPDPGRPNGGGINDSPDGPNYVFTASSMFGNRTQKGMVEVYVNGADFSVILSPRTAREFAMNLLRCAEAAETDEMLIGFAKKAGIEDPAKRARLLIEGKKSMSETTKTNPKAPNASANPKPPGIKINHNLESETLTAWLDQGYTKFAVTTASGDRFPATFREMGVYAILFDVDIKGGDPQTNLIYKHSIARIAPLIEKKTTQKVS